MTSHASSQPVPHHSLGDTSLFNEIRALIEQARVRAAGAVNAELTMLYWQVGSRIRGEILGEKRAGYGQEIVSALGRQLS